MQFHHQRRNVSNQTSLSVAYQKSIQSLSCARASQLTSVESAILRSSLTPHNQIMRRAQLQSTLARLWPSKENWDMVHSLAKVAHLSWGPWPDLTLLQATRLAMELMELYSKSNSWTKASSKRSTRELKALNLSMLSKRCFCTDLSMRVASKKSLSKGASWRTWTTLPSSNSTSHSKTRTSCTYS